MYKSLVAGFICLVALTSQASAADAQLGQQVFKKRCAMCHNPTAARKIGPGLQDVFEREAQSGIGKLTEARLHEWLKCPRCVKPGTRMPTYRVMRDDEKRQSVIEYLKTL